MRQGCNIPKELEQKGQAGGVGISDFNINSKPQEVFGSTRLVSNKHEQAVRLALQRGQHKVTAVIDYEIGSGTTLDNIAKKIDIGGEYKRIFYHKIDVRPLGDGKAQVTLVFHILDNPLPLIPIVWGAAISAGLVSGTFFVKEVNTFTSSIGGLLTIAVGVVVAWFTIFQN